MIPAPQARQHLVADGAGLGRDLVDADPVADQRDQLAAADGLPGRSVTSIAIRSIEMRPAMRQRLPATIASAPGASSVALAARR